MAAPQTSTEFLDLVVKSELVETHRLEPYRTRLQEDSPFAHDVKECAATLIREGIITTFQANLLIRGKWRNFFLGSKYKVLEHLGAGGMGTVFLCEHRYMRRRVAVKLLPPEKSQQPGSLQRFMREAQAVAMLNHPNIVRAYDINQENGVHYLVMEYIDGVNLQNLIDSRGPLTVDRAVQYIAQVAAGLQHAYEAGLIHRDIKPTNVLLERSGIVKILDLGLARFAQNADNLTMMMDSKTVLGTADYLAPEQARDSNVDIRADIYSTGALFHYLLTGKPIFDTGSVAQKLIWHQTRMPTPVNQLRPDVPEGVAAVITRMLAKDPAQRPQIPAQIVADLQPWIVDVPPPAPEELPAHRYTYHRDVDTKCRLSTASLTSVTKQEIREAAAKAAAHSSISLSAVKMS